MEWFEDGWESRGISVSNKAGKTIAELRWSKWSDADKCQFPDIRRVFICRVLIGEGPVARSKGDSPSDPMQLRIPARVLLEPLSVRIVMSDGTQSEATVVYLSKPVKRQLDGLEKNATSQ